MGPVQEHLSSILGKESGGAPKNGKGLKAGSTRDGSVEVTELQNMLGGSQQQGGGTCSNGVGEGGNGMEGHQLLALQQGLGTVRSDFGCGQWYWSHSCAMCACTASSVPKLGQAACRGQVGLHMLQQAISSHVIVRRVNGTR